MTKRREFIALDGEGITRADGAHDYVLLACSDGESIERYDRGGLHSRQVFRFLLDAKSRHPRATFVIFGGSYDFQMWLRSVVRPDNPDAWRPFVQERYFTARDREDASTYRIRCVSRHQFYLARGAWVAGADGRKAWKAAESIMVWDVLGWFQQSFTEAIDAWNVGTRAERRMIADMKADRPAFKARQAPALRRYCLAECSALAALMDELGGALADLGIKPARWDGAGAGARALLAKHHVDDHIVRPADAGIDDAIMRAYLGGRVQTFVTGVLPGATYCYDLKGAYAHALAALPAVTEPIYADPDGLVDELSLCRVRWRTDDRLTPFPHRQDDGAIFWPAEGEGWYWGAEVLAARELAAWPGSPYRCEIDVLERWQFTQWAERRIVKGAGLAAIGVRRPFAFVDALITQRALYKFRNDPRERLIKLIVNTMYGKLVQAKREGERYDRTPRRPPTYQSYIWGGMVTAAIRAQVLRLAAGIPRDELVAIHTDAVFTMMGNDYAPAPERLGDQWVTTRVEPGMLVIQPGVMVSPAQRFVRSRGLGRASLSYRRARAAWLRQGFNATLRISEPRFIGAAYAEAAGRQADWLTWQNVEWELGFSPVPRQFPAPDKASPKPDGLYELLYPPAVEGVSRRYVPRVSEPTIEAAIARNAQEQPDPIPDAGRV